MGHKITFFIGDKEITATYDEWEELYEELEYVFGEKAVEDTNFDPEKLDKLDVEIAFDKDINEN